MENTLQFESPSFIKRLKGMLGVDFYRLFHTPLFYIFLGIAAIIPALVLMGTSTTDPTTGEITGFTITSTWQMIAANTPLYVISDMGEYANMNMVFIFGGIMVSIFIGNDYRSGYAKQLFTTHAKKEDYMMSKSLVCAFAIVCMCVTYIIGTIASGIALQASFEVNVGSLLLALLSKMVLSLGWASMYTFINVILRKYFGVSIALSFFFGTGLPIIGIGAILGNSSGSILNMFLYGSSVFACLSSNIITLLVCLGVSLMWALIYNIVGTIILYRTDVY